MGCEWEAKWVAGCSSKTVPGDQGPVHKCKIKYRDFTKNLVNVPWELTTRHNGVQKGKHISLFSFQVGQLLVFLNAILLK